MKSFFSVVFVCALMATSSLAQESVAISKLPFSAARSAGGTLYISGQIARTADGKDVQDSVAAETHQIMKNLGQILSENGYTYDDLANVTVWLSDIEDYHEMNRAYASYFDEQFPARACTGGAQIVFGFKVEIAAIAYKDEKTINMTITRRQFIQTTALPAGSLALADPSSARIKDSDMSAERLSCIYLALWQSGQRTFPEVFEGGGSVLDAVEMGIHVPEADASNASVGLGGIPNAEGVAQLDACIMDGEGQRAGSVAGIEDILHPISVARRVMDDTKHVMLVGEGARQFALSQGFEKVNLLTEEQRVKWEKWKKEQHKADNHDTIALLGVDGNGRIAGGCSTSGWGYKLPGRVGDSPILGSGLYVDGQVGAAGATGLGENVMRYCASF